MNNHLVTNKTFRLESRKAGPKNTVNETDIIQFINVITENLRNREDLEPYVSPTVTWQPRRRKPDRGFQGERANTARLRGTLL